MSSCTCSELKLNGKPTGQWTVNVNCPQHGVGTKYWTDKFSERKEC